MKSHRDPDFDRALESLPKDVQAQARAAYHLFVADPFHDSLRFKLFRRRKQLWSVRVGIGYRALGIRFAESPEDTIVWFWIGPHAEYDQILRRM